MIGDFVVVPQYVILRRKKLDVDCHRSIHRGHAPGTRDNHRTHHKAYLRFCNEYMFDPFPADEWRTCQFAQF